MTENTNLKTIEDELEYLITNCERNLHWIREDRMRNVTNLEVHVWSSAECLKNNAGKLADLAWSILKDAEENEAIVKEGLDQPDCAPVD